MTKPEEGMEKLNTLNATLGNVEMELLQRRVAQQDAEIDTHLEILATAVKDGTVEICPCADDAQEPATD